MNSGASGYAGSTARAPSASASGTSEPPVPGDRAAHVGAAVQVDQAAPGLLVVPVRPPGFQRLKTGKPCTLSICSS